MRLFFWRVYIAEYYFDSFDNTTFADRLRTVSWSTTTKERTSHYAMLLVSCRAFSLVQEKNYRQGMRH